MRPRLRGARIVRIPFSPTSHRACGFHRTRRSAMFSPAERMAMPLRSTGITLLPRYYGLLSFGCNGHFLPFRSIAVCPAWHLRPKFRRSLYPSLASAAVALLSDPSAVHPPAVGWTGELHSLTGVEQKERGRSSFRDCPAQRGEEGIDMSPPDGSFFRGFVPTPRRSPGHSSFMAPRHLCPKQRRRASPSFIRVRGKSAAHVGGSGRNADFHSGRALPPPNRIQS